MRSRFALPSRIEPSRIDERDGELHCSCMGGNKLQPHFSQAFLGLAMSLLTKRHLLCGPVGQHRASWPYVRARRYCSHSMMPTVRMAWIFSLRRAVFGSSRTSKVERRYPSPTVFLASVAMRREIEIGGQQTSRRTFASLAWGLVGS